ncbi:MAG: methyltransferase domain-containing protein, partial [Bradymonadaceae bacterium]
MDELLLTTNNGLEDIVADEFRALADREGLDYESIDEEPFGLGGRILVRTDEPADRLVPVVETMRSIHHVLHYIEEFALPDEDPLEAIESRLFELDLPEMTDAETFRVTSNRYGEHDFTSVDVQRAAGGGVDCHYSASVDLEDYDVDVRVDVQQNRCLVGIQYTKESLSTRFPHVYAPRASLKSNVAYGMLQLAHVPTHDPETLLDPFCGAGTVLMETAEVYPEIALYGSDISERAVRGATANIETAGLDDHVVDIQQGDARELYRRHDRGAIDLIVTNPPYGKRLGADLNFHAFYRDVLGQFVRTLSPEGRVVMLVHKRGVFRGAIGDYPQFDIRHVRIVETGGL